MKMLVFLCIWNDLCEIPAQAVIFSMTSIDVRNNAEAASTPWTSSCSTEVGGSSASALECAAVRVFSTGTLVEVHAGNSRAVGVPALALNAQQPDIPQVTL